MGISLEGETSDMVLKSFSDDVLKIELSGPDYEHFSVVDLPGLFRSMFSTLVELPLLRLQNLPTPGKTTKDDTTFVKKIVRDYLHNTRSIIM